MRFDRSVCSTCLLLLRGVHIGIYMQSRVDSLAGGPGPQRQSQLFDRARFLT